MKFAKKERIFTHTVPCLQRTILNAKMIVIHVMILNLVTQQNQAADLPYNTNW